MLYTGIDMHSKWFTLWGFEKETGEMFEQRKTNNDEESVRELFSRLPGPRCGAMEAGTNAVAMHRLLAPYFTELIIVSANQVWDRKRDTRAKTDRRDAEGLALKLAKGELKPLFIPSDDLREWQTLGRARIQVTQDVTRQTNRLYALARRWGYLDEKKLLTKKGRAWLDTLRLPDRAHQVLTTSLDNLETLQQREKVYDQAMAALVKEDPVCQLLMTIPFVGPFTAFILRSEIGDISRFKRADQLISYSGLNPRVFQSGDLVRYGQLSKAGNAFLRYVAVLYATNCLKGKKDTPFKRRYYRLCHLHDKNEIKVKLARDFIAVVHSMWTKQSVWHDDRQDIRAKSSSVA